MSSKNICNGNGECLCAWQYTDNTFHPLNYWICDHKCKPKKCTYHTICNNLSPEWLFNANDKMCLYCSVNRLGCKTTPSEVLIYKNKECPICLEEKDCVQYKNCEHHICIGCYKMCFKEYDEDEPKFPYSDQVYDKYYHEALPELQNTLNRDYPLIKNYESNWDVWNDCRREKYNNATNLRKCALCRL